MENIVENKPHHKKAIIRPIATFLSVVAKVYDKYIKSPILKKELGSCGKHVVFRWNEWHQPWANVFLSDYTQLVDARIISHGGRLIIKQGSGAAEGFTVITNNHKKVAGDWIRNQMDSRENDFEKDIIVEEDVWIGANVTLLGDAFIGRGAVVGAGSVIRTKIPPYAIVTGNPAKIIGFSLRPEEVVEHEKALYPEEARLPLDLLEKNFNKYFLKRLTEIKEFNRL